MGSQKITADSVVLVLNQYELSVEVMETANKAAEELTRVKSEKLDEQTLCSTRYVQA